MPEDSRTFMVEITFWLLLKFFIFIAQVFVNVVHVGVGPISQSDLDLAQACGACIVGFNIKSPPSSVSLEATQAGIKVQSPVLECWFLLEILVLLLG